MNKKIIVAIVVSISLLSFASFILAVSLGGGASLISTGNRVLLIADNTINFSQANINSNSIEFYNLSYVNPNQETIVRFAGLGVIDRQPIPYNISFLNITQGEYQSCPSCRPLSYYHLDETSGTVVTDVFGKYNGTSYQVYLNQSGILNSSYAFRFTNGSYVKLDNNTFFRPTNNFSVSTWFKMDKNENGVFVASATQYGGTYRIGGFLLQFDGNNVSFVTSNNAVGASTITTSGKNYADNQWHQVVATYTDGTGKIYVDGSLNVTGTSMQTPSYDGNTQTYFGVRYDVLITRNNYWNGTLDEIGLWNTTLTATDVSNLQATKNWDLNYSATKTSYFPYVSDSLSTATNTIIVSNLTNIVNNFTVQFKVNGIVPLNITYTSANGLYNRNYTISDYIWTPPRNLYSDYINPSDSIVTLTIPAIEKSSGLGNRLNITADLFYPKISFGTGVAANNSNLSQNYIYANITLSEDRLREITYYLYGPNTNVTVYGNNNNTQTVRSATKNHTWFNLSDGIYYYEIKACDFNDQCNSTGLRKITLDTTKPNATLINPSNLTVTSNSTINFTANFLDNLLYKYCYQEDPIVPNQGASFGNPDGNCSLNYSGVFPTNSNLYDTYINYTKPSGSVGATALFKNGGYGTGGINASSVHSLPIPSSCWNYLPNKLMIKTYQLLNQNTNDYSDYSCYNGTQWIILSYETRGVYGAEGGFDGAGFAPAYCSSSAAGLRNDGDWNTGSFAITNCAYPNNIFRFNVVATIYEESMIWTIPATTDGGIKNATLNIYNSTGIYNQTTTSYPAGTITSTLGIVVTLVDNAYTWFYSLFDWAGNSYTTQNNTLWRDANNISLCHPIDSSGSYYLDKNITATGDCFEIKANNVLFDCNKNSLTGPGGLITYRGIFANGYNNITIQNCNITNFGTQISLTNSQNSTIKNIQSRFNAVTNVYGINLTNTVNTQITNLTLTNNTVMMFYGIYQSGANFTTISNSTIKDNPVSGLDNKPYVGILNNYNTSIINSILTTTRVNSVEESGYGFYARDSQFNNLSMAHTGSTASRNNVLLNTTTTNRMGVIGSTSTVTKQWYVTLSSADQFGANLPDATFTIYDKLGTLIFNGNSNLSGSLSALTALTEATLNETNFYYNTPHNVTVSKALYYTNTTSINLTATQNTVYQIRLFQDIVAPDVAIQYPLATDYITNVTALNFTVSDPNLQTCWYTLNGGPNVITPCGTNLIGLTSVEGSNTWTIYANDTFNNIGSDSVVFFKDSINPTINFVIPTDSAGAYLNRNNILINVTSVDSNLGNITINLYNSTAFVNSANSTVTPLYVNFSGLNNGIYYFNATSYDTLGNKNSTITRNVTIDTVKPLIDYSSNNPVNFANLSQSNIYVNVTYTEINFANITFTVRNSSWSNVTTYLTPVTSINITNLANGGYWYFVNITDIANNVNSTAIRNITLDTTNPNATLVSPANATYSNSSSNNFTANITDNLGIKNATLNIYNSTSLVNRTTVNYAPNTLTNTVGIVVSLANNVYTWFYSLFDWAGNNFISNNNTMTVDTVKSLISYSSNNPVNFANLSQSNIYINTTITEINFANITFNIYNSSWSNVTTYLTLTNSINVTGLADGRYWYFVNITDLANNKNSTAVHNITLDTVKPLVSLVYPITANYTFNISSLNYTASDINLAVCKYSLNGGVTNITITCGTNVTSLTSTEGSNTWKIYVNDYAGNSNSSSVTFFKDTVGPVINIISPTATTYGSTSIPFNFTVSDAGIGISSCWYRNDTDVSNITVNCNSNLTLSNIDGTHNLYFWANDTLGNLANKTLSYEISTTAPTTVLDNPTNNKYTNNVTVLFNFTSTDPDGISACQLWGNWSGAWAINQTVTSITSGIQKNFALVTLPQGTYLWNVKCNDTDNNAAFALNNRTLTIDTINPLVDWGSGTAVNGANLSQSNINMNVTYTEINFDTINYVIYNNTAQFSNNIFSAPWNSGVDYNTTGIPDGVWYYNSTICDLAGNCNTTSTRTITLDTANPNATLIYPSNNYYSNSSSNNFTANISDNLGIKNATLNIYQSQKQSEYHSIDDDGDWTETTNQLIAQTFTIGSNGYNQNFNISRLSLRLWKQGSPTGIGVLRLTLLDGSNKPSEVIANSTIDASTISASHNWVEFILNGTVQLNANTKYGITWQHNGDVTNHIVWAGSDKSLFPDYAGGRVWGSNDNGVTWADTPGGPGMDFDFNLTIYSTLVNQTTVSYAPNTLTNTVGIVVSLANNVYTWFYSLFDWAGNNFISNNNTMTVDTVKSLISYSSNNPVNFANLSQSNIYINTTLTEINFANITYNIYNSSWSNVTTYLTAITSINVTGLADGRYWYYVNVTDLANNKNSTAIRNITLDSTKPLISYSSNNPINGLNVSQSNVYINVTYTELNFKNITFRVNSSLIYFNTTGITNWNFTGLADGVYNYNVTVCDIANNCNITTTQRITLDTTKPLISIVYPIVANYSTNVSELNYTVSDNNIKSCWYTLNGGVTNTTVTCGTNKTLLTSTQGTNTWTIYVNDTAGNVNSSSVTFFKDTVNPTITLTYPGVYINITDSTGRYNATAINATLDSASAKFGTAGVRLDNNYGTFAKITTPITQSVLNLSNEDFTLCAWFYNRGDMTNSSGSRLGQSIITTYPGSSPQTTLLFDYTNSRVQITTRNSTNTISSSSPTNSAPKNAWNFACMVINRSEGNGMQRIYLNGVNSTNYTMAQGRISNQNIYIGGPMTTAQSTDTYFNGSIDEVRIFNRTLSASEIANLYATNTMTDTNGLVAYYPLDLSLVSSSTVNFNYTLADSGIGLDNATLHVWNATEEVLNVPTGALSGAVSALISTSQTLIDGVYNWFVSAFDLLGNSFTSQNSTFEIDTTYPTISYSANNPVNFANKSQSNIYVNVTYTEINFANVTFNIYNSSWSNVTTYLTEVTSINVTGLANGKYWYYVNVTDLSNLQNSTAIYNITLDTSRATIQIVYPVAANYSTNVSELNYTLSDNDLSNCWYSRNNGVTNVTITCGNNVTAITSTEGSNTWKVWANDTSGNVNVSSVNFFKDTIKPRINYSSDNPVNFANLSQSHIYINTTITETNFANITFNIYNSSWSNVTTYLTLTNSIDVTGLGDGRYWYFVNITDIANNVNSTAIRNITLDTISPNVQIIYPQAINYSVSSPSLNYSAYDSGSGLSVCEYSLNSGYVTTTCGTNVSGLFSNEGTNTWIIRVNDSAGNSNSSAVIFYRDSTAPVITIASPIDGFTYGDSTIDFNHTVIDSGIGLSSCWYNNDTNPTNTSVNCNFNQSFTLADGSHSITLWANDTLNNVANTTITFQISTTVPVINLVSPTNNYHTNVQSTVFNFTVTTPVQPLQICQLWGNWSGSYSLNQTIVPAQGSNIFSTIILNEGQYLWAVWCNDSLNNYAISNNNTLIIDLTNPNATLVLPINASYINSSTVNFNYSVSDNLGLENSTLNIYNSTDLYYSTVTTWAGSITGAVSIPVALLDGIYNWFVSLFDQGMNTFTSGNNTITVDTTSPVIDFGTGTLADGSYMPQSNIYIDVTYTETNFANITFQAGANTYFNNTGILNHNFTGLAQGTYTYNVTICDRVNHCEITATRTIILDMTAPNATLLAPSNGSYSNTSIIDFIYNTTDETLLSNATLHVWNSTTEVYNTGSTLSGLETLISMPLALLDGVYNWFVSLFDYSGNSFTTGNNTLTVDTTSPVIDFGTGTLSNNSFASQSNIYLDAVYTETNFANITFQAGANTYFNNTGITNYNFTSLANGVYTYNITLCDKANYCSITSTRTITLDTVKPLVSLVYPTAINYSINVSALNYTVSDTNLQACWYSLNGGITNATVTCGTNKTNLISIEGLNTWTIYANDSAGNVNSSSVTFFKDTVKPSITYSSNNPVNFANLSQSNIDINTTITETNFANITFNIYNSSWSNVTTYLTPVTSINITNLANGGYWYFVNITDIANNVNSTAIRNITLDTTNPNATLVLPTNATRTINVSNNFTANISDNLGIKNATLNIYNSTSLVNETTVTYSANILTSTVGVVVTLIDNTYNWFYSLFDWAGNSFATTNNTLTIDSTAPTLNIVSPTSTVYNTLEVQLNYTVSDSGGLSSCWYMNDTDAVNITIACGTNVTINNSEGTHTIHLWANDTFNNVAYKNVTYLTAISVPAINLINPTSNQYFDGTQIRFNFTASDTQGIDTCQLWGNWSGAWALEETKNGIVNYAVTNFNLVNIVDGSYIWNVWCNDTTNLGVWSINNLTFTVDTVSPTIDYGPNNLAEGVNVSQSNIYIDTTWTEANFKNITFDIYRYYDINLSISAGYNLIGISSEQNISLSNIRFNGLNYGQAKIIYNFSINSTINLTPKGTEVTILESGKGYWVYAAEAGNLTLPGVGGSLSNETYRLSDLMFSNGTSELNITNARVAGWISSSGINNLVQYWDGSNWRGVYDDPDWEYDQVFYSWKGYFVYGQRDNIKVMRQNGQNITTLNTGWNSFVLNQNPDLKIKNATFTSNSIIYSNNFTSILDGHFIYAVKICDLANHCVDSGNRQITLDTTGPTVTLDAPTNNTNTNISSVTFNYTISDIGGLNNAAVHIWDNSGEVYSLYSTLSGALVAVISIPETIVDGVYTWFVTAFDLLGNSFTTPSNILTVDTADHTAPTITITSPLSQTYSTDNILLNVTPSETISSYWYNLGAGNVSFNNGDIINFNAGINNLQVYAQDAGGNVGSSSVIFTVNYNSVLNVNLNTTPSIPQIGSNLSLIVNATTVNTQVSECNFSLVSPSRTILNNIRGTGSGVNKINWISSSYILNETGTYLYNVTCINEFGATNSVSKNFTISSYNLTVLEPLSPFSFTAKLAVDEVKDIAFKLYDNVDSTVNYNMNVQIESPTNFALTYPSTFQLNNSDSSNSPSTFLFQIQAALTTPVGLYDGNVTLTNTITGQITIIYFTYGVNPPAAIPRLFLSDALTTCNGIFGGACSINLNQLNQGASSQYTFKMATTGNFLYSSNCSAKFTGNLNQPWIVATPSVFGLTPNSVDHTLTLTLSPGYSVPAVTYSGNMLIYCNQTDALGSPSDSDNSVRIDIQVYSVSTLGPSGGEGTSGGGGSTDTAINLTEQVNLFQKGICGNRVCEDGTNGTENYNENYQSCAADCKGNISPLSDCFSGGPNCIFKTTTALYWIGGFILLILLLTSVVTLKKKQGPKRIAYLPTVSLTKSKKKSYY